jgi:hypothetical protein
VLVNTWMKHPELMLIRPAVPPPGGPEFIGKDYASIPWYGAKQLGLKKLARVETLGYPSEASDSYELFCVLRNQGVIPPGVRFQQSLPFPDDAVRLFTNNPRNMDLMVDAYIDVMKRDLALLCAHIPHEDLVLQWDINWETLAIELGDHLPDEAPMQFKPNRDPMDRFLRYVQELNAEIPPAVQVGMHLCYGDLAHKHFREPASLATSVLMANNARKVSPRPINFVQMSVPIDRNDDAFFEPLEDLQFGDGTVYAGVLHYKDGIEGSKKRLEAFKRHYKGITGVSTECGLGRRPADQELTDLLKIHRDVAAAI